MRAQFIFGSLFSAFGPNFRVDRSVRLCVCVCVDRRRCFAFFFGVAIEKVSVTGGAHSAAAAVAVCVATAELQLIAPDKAFDRPVFSVLFQVLFFVRTCPLARYQLGRFNCLTFGPPLSLSLALYRHTASKPRLQSRCFVVCLRRDRERVL